MVYKINLEKGWKKKTRSNHDDDWWYVGEEENASVSHVNMVNLDEESMHIDQSDCTSANSAAILDEIDVSKAIESDNEGGHVAYVDGWG